MTWIRILMADYLRAKLKRQTEGLLELRRREIEFVARQSKELK